MQAYLERTSMNEEDFLQTHLAGIFGPAYPRHPPICSWCYKPILPVHRFCTRTKVEWDGERYRQRAHYLHLTVKVDEDGIPLFFQGGRVALRIKRYATCWYNWEREPEHQ